MKMCFLCDKLMCFTVYFHYIYQLTVCTCDMMQHYDAKCVVKNGDKVRVQGSIFCYNGKGKNENGFFCEN